MCNWSDRWVGRGDIIQVEGNTSQKRKGREEQVQKRSSPEESQVTEIADVRQESSNGTLQHSSMS